MVISKLSWNLLVCFSFNVGIIVLADTREGEKSGFGLEGVWLYYKLGNFMATGVFA